MTGTSTKTSGLIPPIIPENQRNQPLNEEENQNHRNIEAKRAPPYKTAEFIPHYDGKNYEVNFIIKKLKRLKGLYHEVDEPYLVRYIIERFSGDLYNNLCDNTYNTINALIEAIIDNVPINKSHIEARAELEHILQKEDEKVISFHQRLHTQAQSVLDLYKDQERPDNNNAQAYANLIQNCKFNQLKFGLRQDIRSLLTINENETYDQILEKAKNIEKQFLKINDLKKTSKLNETDHAENHSSKINSVRISSCQICHDSRHEAFMCENSACAYCKQTDHFTKDCSIAVNKMKFSCKLCANSGHTIDRCNLRAKNSSYCQYCQTLGHTVTNCDHINSFVVCYKCKETGHDAYICKKEIKDNISNKPCENCNEIGHEIKDCPKITCVRCNKVGHTAKFCTVNKRGFCYLCQVEDHTTTDCETLQCLTVIQKNQNKQTTNIPLIKCNACQKVGHIAKNCRANLNSQTNPLKCQYCKQFGHTADNCPSILLINKSDKPQSCQFCKKIGHSIENCYTLKRQNSTQQQIIKCSICQKPGHIASTCWRNQNTKSIPYMNKTASRPSFQNSCQICQKIGHEGTSCPKFIDLQVKTGQTICKYCKETTHTIDGCTKKPQNINCIQEN